MRRAILFLSVVIVMCLPMQGYAGVKQDPNKVFELGAEAFQGGDYEKAEELLKTAIGLGLRGEQLKGAEYGLGCIKQIGLKRTRKKAVTGMPPADYKDPVTGMEFILVKGGCFHMGDTFGDGHWTEKPVHEVCVRDYFLGQFEVTQSQWQKVMGNNPSRFKGCGDCPVEQVSWNDVQGFIKKLKERTGLEYRLPTEAEWEYAARSGGKKEKYAGTSSEKELGEYAWYGANSCGATSPVGLMKPNGLGIYDMSGNVFEWCADWGDRDEYDSQSPRDNPTGPTSGLVRVMRGGWFGVPPQFVRASHRNDFSPADGNHSHGFRLAGTP